MTQDLELRHPSVTLRHPLRDIENAAEHAQNVSDMAHCKDDNIPDALAILETGADGGLWLVPWCPWCRGSHVHGAGPSGENEDPERFLGVSRADCGRTYRLVRATEDVSTALRRARDGAFGPLVEQYRGLTGERWRSRARRSTPALRGEVLRILVERQVGPFAPPGEPGLVPERRRGFPW